MLDTSKLTIDPSSLGNNLLLVDVKPWFSYENGERQAASIGYKYTVASEKMAFEKITVKIKGNQLVDLEDGYVKVAFTGLTLKLYVINGQAMLSAEAKDVKVIGKA